MSILNAITLGGGSTWTAVTNTAATATAITFPAAHAPTAWAVFRITNIATNDSTPLICYIDEDNGTYYEWGIYKESGGRFNRGGTPTGSYSSGTFTVTRGTSSFTTTVGDYVLVYI